MCAEFVFLCWTAGSAVYVLCVSECVVLVQSPFSSNPDSFVAGFAAVSCRDTSPFGRISSEQMSHVGQVGSVRVYRSIFAPKSSLF